MTSTSDRLQQLLDGELDPAEIADDPTLVSLADRIYGIKIAPVQPIKAREIQTSPSTGITEVAPPTHMLVEVIEPQAPAIPLPLPGIDLPPKPQPAKIRRPLLPLSLLVISILNLFGAFGHIFGSLCDPSDLCPNEGYNRINWASIHQIANGNGWSLTILEGSFGIPDLVAVICSVVLVVFFSGRK
ncbi:MAG TPA: hypothetical protein QGI72_05155 [Poseidonia sp.]|nr:hypothetical protein [Poseidonia sp.]